MSRPRCWSRLKSQGDTGAVLCLRIEFLLTLAALPACFAPRGDAIFRARMRLRVHCIVGRRYFEAGSEIDDAIVPETMRRYRCSDEEADRLLAEARVRREKREAKKTRVSDGASPCSGGPDARGVSE
jgi:hypothetical protein